MAEELVLYKKEGSVGIVTINRSHVRNALNREVFSAFSKILEDIKKDKDVRAIIITGAGSAFVAGADVGELSALSPVSGWFESRLHQSILDNLEQMRIPSIAAINGPALGGGLELALACTFRIASNKAKLGLPELSLGILPGFGGTQRLMRIVGYAKTVEMLLTSVILNAEDAYKIGLVNTVVPHDLLIEEAKKIAHTIAKLNPLTVKLAMELLLKSRDSDIDEGLSMESALACLTLASEETKVLLNAFLKNK